jgi:HMG (high mobility group) box
MGDVFKMYRYTLLVDFVSLLYFKQIKAQISTLRFIYQDMHAIDATPTESQFKGGVFTVVYVRIKGCPRRPLNAYNLFFKDKRPIWKDCNETSCSKFSHLGKTIGALWKVLPESEKQPYKEQAKKLKEEYDVKIQIWKATPEYAASLKELKATPAYAALLKEKKSVWRVVPESEKQPYKKHSNKLKEEYDEENQMWKATQEYALLKVQKRMQKERISLFLL